MMKINWSVRAKNKHFWLAFLPAILLLIKQALAMFGVDFDAGTLSDQLSELVSTAFVVLALLGVVNDPTTAGLQDSEQAMSYETPKESDAE